MSGSARRGCLSLVAAAQVVACVGYLWSIAAFLLDVPALAGMPETLTYGYPVVLLLLLLLGWVARRSLGTAGEWPPALVATALTTIFLVASAGVAVLTTALTLTLGSAGLGGF